MIAVPGTSSNRVRGRVEGSSDLIGELVRMTKPISAASVRRLLGAKQHESLSSRQLCNLRWKLDTIRGWDAYRRAAGVERGGIELAREAFARGMPAVWGRGVSPRTLQKWEHRFKLGGAAGLVDRRGRPRGQVALDAALLLEFCKLVRRGIGVRAAHWQIRGRAIQEGVWWPCIETLRARLREGRAIVEGRPHARGNPRYLVKAVSKN